MEKKKKKRQRQRLITCVLGIEETFALSYLCSSEELCAAVIKKMHFVVL